MKQILFLLLFILATSHHYAQDRSKANDLVKELIRYDEDFKATHRNLGFLKYEQFLPIFLYYNDNDLSLFDNYLTLESDSLWKDAFCRGFNSLQISNNVNINSTDIFNSKYIALLKINEIESDGDTHCKIIFFEKEENKYIPIYEDWWAERGKRKVENITDKPVPAFKYIGKNLALKLNNVNVNISIGFIEHDVRFNDNEVFFFVQNDGSFITKDGKNFLVYDLPGMDKKEIFNGLIKAIKTNYNSDLNNLKIDTVEDELIIINDALSFYKDGEKGAFAASYQLKIQIKDNRIRIEAPVVSDVAFDSNITRILQVQSLLLPGVGVAVGAAKNTSKIYTFKEFLKENFNLFDGKSIFQYSDPNLIGQIRHINFVTTGALYKILKEGLNNKNEEDDW